VAARKGQNTHGSHIDDLYDEETDVYIYVEKVPKFFFTPESTIDIATDGFGAKISFRNVYTWNE